MKILRSVILYGLWALAGVVGWLLLFPPGADFKRVAAPMPAGAERSHGGETAIPIEAATPWDEEEMVAGGDAPADAEWEVIASAPAPDVASPSDISVGAAPGALPGAASTDSRQFPTGVSTGESVTAHSAGGLSFSGTGVGGGGTGVGSLGVGNIGAIGHGGSASNAPVTMPDTVHVPAAAGDAAEADPVPIQLNVATSSGSGVGSQGGQVTRDATVRPRIRRTTVGQAAAPAPRAAPAPTAPAADVPMAAAEPPQPTTTSTAVPEPPPQPAAAAPEIVTSTDSGPEPPPSLDGGAFGELDRIIDSLQIGTIAFNTPETIPLGESADIELVLSPQQTAEIEQQLRESVGGPGPIETAQIPISYSMQAQLQGTGVAIFSSSPLEQAVSLREPTRWKWTIEPERSDTLELDLTLSAVVPVQGELTPRAIKTFERTILVNVPPMVRVARFLSTYQEVILTLLVLPVAGWAYRRVRRNRKRRRPPPAPPEVTREAA